MNHRIVSSIAVGLTVSLLTGCSDLVDKAPPSGALQQTAPGSAPSSENAPPSISGNPNTNALIGQAWTFTPSAADPDGDAITFAIDNQPTWANFDQSTGRLSGIPQLGQQGRYAGISISAHDGDVSAALPPFSVTVLNTSANSAPVISGSPPGVVMTGVQYMFEPTADDPDGDPLIFSVSGMPVWASFDISNGQLTGTPVDADIGLYADVVVSVSDGQQFAALPEFSIDVQRPAVPNSAPVILGNAPTAGQIGENYLFEPSASDTDGDVLTFAIVNRPGWASFDASSGTLTGTPTPGDAGTYRGIVVSVSDGQLTSALAEFDITIQDLVISNRAPQISGAPASSATVAELYLFQPGASDPDGDDLAFSIANRPSWASFSSVTGMLAGAPATSDEGSHQNILISVTDGELSAALPAFSISVDNPDTNEAPQISGSPPLTVTVADTYSFQPTATDAEDDDLAFAIANRPSWASFSSVTGTLAGAPAETDEGTHRNIVISVTDGELSAALPAFSIRVDNPDTNEAPQISGSPPLTVTVGDLYSFQPTATDADGDDLTFSISNRPAWASFDTASGRLSGPVVANDEGIYGNIVVTVSDGSLSDSLTSFEISVLADEINEPPTISGSPTTSATVDQLYSFQPTAADPDGDNLSFTIANRPAWAAFDSDTGLLSGTPLQGDAAVYNDIRITVSDGELSTSLPAFSINVSQVASGSATLSWTAPALNTDGSALTDLSAFKIYYGTSPGDYPNEEPIDNPGVTTYVIENLSSGTYYFVVTSINDREIESIYSNEASKTIN